MKGIWADIRLSLRRLNRSRKLAATLILTLAVGIGPSTAIYSVIKGLLLSPQHYKDADRITRIWGTWRDDRSASVSVPNFVDIRKQSTLFESCSIYAPLSFRFGEDSRKVTGLGVAAGFFDVFGVAPVYGRTFAPSEERGDARYRVVILSYGLWQRRFGSDPEIIGKEIDVNGRTPTVVGVMPEDFGSLPTKESSHHQYQLWVPLNLDQANFQIRRFHMLNMVAKLRVGVSMEQAQRELDTIARDLERIYPEDNRDRGLRIEDLRSATLGEIEPILHLVIVAVGIVLLIACTNVANLLLARAVAREGELAARLAFGARWWHVFRLVFSEAMVVSILAGIAGFFLGAWGVRLLVALSPDQVGRLQGVEVDARVVIFTLLISVFSGLLVAAAPTFRTSRVQLRHSLAAGGLRGKGKSSRRGMSIYLVVFEVSLAVLLMTSAVAMLRSLQSLLDVDTGFDADRIVTAWVDSYSPELVERLQALPGVEAAGAVTVIPIISQRSMLYQFPYSVADKSEQDLAGDSYVYLRGATPGYFRAMGIQVLQGRGFLASDESGAAVISQSLAANTWPNENPIGKQITISVFKPVRVRVIGVVENVRQASLEHKPLQDVYVPWTSSGQRGMDIVVRGDADVMPAMRAILTDSVGDGTPQVKWLQEAVSETVDGKRFVIWLLGVFSGIATLLALVGVYGSLSYWVSTQIPALALRMVLGAKPWDLVLLVLGRCVAMVSAGILLGLAASLVLSRISGSYFPGLILFNISAYSATTVGFALMAVLAALGPALWAAKSAPAVALRYE